VHPTIVGKVATELLRKGCYLDVDPMPTTERGLGFHRFRIVTPQSIPTNQLTAISSNQKTTKGRRDAKSCGSVE